MFLLISISVTKDAHPYATRTQKQLPPTSFIRSYPSTFWQRACWYPVSAEGYALLGRHCHDAYSERWLVSGILADWLEDHRDELLVGAAGPTDPAERLDCLIAYLRHRFHQQFEG